MEADAMQLFFDPHDKNCIDYSFILERLELPYELVDVSQSAGSKQAQALGISGFPAIYAHGKVIRGQEDVFNFLLSFPSSAPLRAIFAAIARGLSDLASKIAYYASAAQREGQQEETWAASWREENAAVSEEDFAAAVNELVSSGLWPWRSA
jgi:hypothetical protein